MWALSLRPVPQSMYPGSYQGTTSKPALSEVEGCRTRPSEIVILSGARPESAKEGRAKDLGVLLIPRPAVGETRSLGSRSLPFGRSHFARDNALKMSLNGTTESRALIRSRIRRLGECSTPLGLPTLPIILSWHNRFNNLHWVAGQLAKNSQDRESF